MKESVGYSYVPIEMGALFVLLTNFFSTLLSSFKGFIELSIIIKNIYYKANYFTRCSLNNANYSRLNN